MVAAYVDFVDFFSHTLATGRCLLQWQPSVRPISDKFLDLITGYTCQDIQKGYIQSEASSHDQSQRHQSEGVHQEVSCTT